MLVLRRKAGEAIVLNGVITIHVLAVEGERVKLGISAPPEVVIVRSELLENQGQMPGGPGSSGGYWSATDPRRPGRDHGGHGGYGGNGGNGGDSPYEGGPGHVESRSNGYAADTFRTVATPSPAHNGQIRED
jgi:carbon storage regulator